MQIATVTRELIWKQTMSEATHVCPLAHGIDLAKVMIAMASLYRTMQQTEEL